MGRHGFDFTPRDDIPMWQTAIAWIALLALIAVAFRLCCVPVMRSVGEAMRKESGNG